MAKKKGSSKVKKDKKKKDNIYNQEIIGICISLLGLIIAISLFDFNMGIVGLILKNSSFFLMGFGAYLLPIILIAIGMILIIGKFKKREKKISIYISLIFLSVLIILDSVNSLDYKFLHRMQSSVELRLIGKGGGVIGNLFGFFFYHFS